MPLPLEPLAKVRGWFDGNLLCGTEVSLVEGEQLDACAAPTRDQCQGRQLGLQQGGHRRGAQRHCAQPQAQFLKRSPEFIHPRLLCQHHHCRNLLRLRIALHHRAIPIDLTVLVRVKRAQLIIDDFSQLWLSLLREAQKSNQNCIPRQTRYDAGIAEVMAVKKGGNLRRRVVAARFWKLQFVNQQVAAKSASKNREAIRPAATINANNEFRKHKKQPCGSQESEVRSQNEAESRDLDCAAGRVRLESSPSRVPQDGGFRLTRKWLERPVRLANFEFRISNSRFILTPDSCLLTSPLIPARRRTTQ
ncbi:hypothetical protein SBA2_670071 [Acidobacteriia bacterium SbA2]|nr:hypothetical protein SBA2_670071 [Acidobacteriia bacterium SbA2]